MFRRPKLISFRHWRDKREYRNRPEAVVDSLTLDSHIWGKWRESDTNNLPIQRFFFVLVLVSAFIAFWPGHLSRISDEPAVVVHIHGVLMTLWLAMLIDQAYLIRTNRREIHKKVGKFSYLLAPLVSVFIAVIRHNAMVETGLPVAEQNLRLVIPNTVVQPLIFVFTYLLAIYYRRDPATHARFMLCTPIPMAGPIFNRVLEFQLGVNPAIAAQLTGNSVLASLALLSIWDWLRHRRLNVFPVVLMFMVVLRQILRNFMGPELRLQFAEWYMSLPLP